MHITDPSALAESLLPQVARPISHVPLGAGRSGAQVHELASGDARFVLKIGTNTLSQSRWAMARAIHEAAAGVGVAPAVIASDVEARAIVSDYVSGPSFFSALFDAERIESALGSLVDQIAALHAIDVAGFRDARTPRQRCREVVATLAFEVPAFAQTAWEEVQRHPDLESTHTLCHLDLNPSNVLFDGQKVWLIDWDTAGRSNRWVDLATVVNMFLLPPERERWVLERYASRIGIPMPSPARFADARRLAYVGYGFAFLDLVRAPPASLPLGDAPLGQCYRALNEGRLSLDTDAGRFQFAHACFAGRRGLL